MATPPKSAGTDALDDELAALAQKDKEQDQRLTDIEARLDDIEAGGGDGGTDPVDPPVIPPEPPVTGNGAPSGWNDARFKNMSETTKPMMVEGGQTISNKSIDCSSSGDAAFNSHGAYSGKLLRTKCREGIRVSARGTYLFEDVYIEFAGSGSDHGDGVQFYGPGNAPKATFRRVTIICKPGSNNCCFFAADHADADITLEDFYFDGTGASSAHGALWLPASDPDFGCLKLSAKNGILKGYKGSAFSPNKGLSKVTVSLWENIKDDKGNPVPNPKG